MHISSARRMMWTFRSTRGSVFWKGQFTRRSARLEWRRQSHHWDTRLRRGENYSEKWEYVRQNPVRAGLVADADQWPYQGELSILPW
jgi:hypothetical protein